MSYAQKAIKGFLWVFLFSTLAGLLGYLFRILLARRLSPEEVGLFFAVYTFFWFFAYLRDWGLPSALVRFLPGYVVRKADRKLSDALMSVFLVQLFFGLLFSVLFFLLADWLALHYFHAEEASLLVKLFAPIFLVIGLKTFGRSVLQGLQRMFWYALVYFLENALLVLALALLLVWSPTPLAPVAAYVLSFSLIMLLTLGLIRAPLLAGRWNRPLLAPIFSFGLAVMIGGFASMVYLYTDTMVLTYFRPLAEVGVYNVAVTAAMMLTFFSRPLTEVFSPLVSELAAGKRQALLQRGVALSQLANLAVILPVGLFLFAFPESFLTLVFGAEYLAGVPWLRLLIVATFLLVAGLLNLSILNALGFPEASRDYGLAAAAINLVLNLLLIPRFGAVAAAATTLLSYAFLFVASSIQLRRRSGLLLPWRGWWRLAAASLLSLGAAWALKGLLFPAQPLLKVAVTLLLAGALYLGLVLLFRVFSREETALFRTQLRRLLSR